MRLTRTPPSAPVHLPPTDISPCSFHRAAPTPPSIQVPAVVRATLRVPPLSAWSSATATRELSGAINTANAAAATPAAGSAVPRAPSPRDHPPQPQQLPQPPQSHPQPQPHPQPPPQLPVPPLWRGNSASAPSVQLSPHSSSAQLLQRQRDGPAVENAGSVSETSSSPLTATTSNSTSKKRRLEQPPMLHNQGPVEPKRCCNDSCSRCSCTLSSRNSDATAACSAAQLKCSSTRAGQAAEQHLSPSGNANGHMATLQKTSPTGSHQLAAASASVFTPQQPQLQQKQQQSRSTGSHSSTAAPRPSLSQSHRRLHRQSYHQNSMQTASQRAQPSPMAQQRKQPQQGQQQQQQQRQQQQTQKQPSANPSSLPRSSPSSLPPHAPLSATAQQRASVTSSAPLAASAVALTGATAASKSAATASAATSTASSVRVMTEPCPPPPLTDVLSRVSSYLSSLTADKLDSLDHRRLVQMYTHQLIQLRTDIDKRTGDATTVARTIAKLQHRVTQMTASIREAKADQGRREAQHQQTMAAERDRSEKRFGELQQQYHGSQQRLQQQHKQHMKEMQANSLLSPGDLLDRRYGPTRHRSREPVDSGTSPILRPRRLHRLQHAPTAVPERPPSPCGQLCTRSARTRCSVRRRSRGPDCAAGGFRIPGGIHVYPVAAPDLATARRLAGGDRRSAVLYFCGDRRLPTSHES